MIILPNRTNKRLVQLNRSNTLGDLWSSYNLDLQDNLGTIRVANRLKLLTKTGDANATNLGTPVSFQAFDGLLWAVAGTRVFKNSKLSTLQSSLTAFVEDSSTGAVTTYTSDYSDLSVFNDCLISTASAKLYSKVADGSGTGAWTERASLDASTPHKLCYFKKQNRIYVTTNQSIIKSLDTGWTISTSSDPYYINIPNVSNISSIVSAAQQMWIVTNKSLLNTSTQNNNNECDIFSWDGISATPSNPYPIPAKGVVAIIIRNDIPIVLDTNGILREFNGTGFKEIGRLPLRRGQSLASYPTDVANDRYVHPNGMLVTPDNTILVNVCGRDLYLTGVTERLNENLPSGLWEWSQENGFVHRTSFSYSTVGSSSVTDYGQQRIARSGALAYAKLGVATAQNTLICGAQYYTDATTTTNGIFIDSPFPTNDSTYPEGEKFGYFTTVWFQSSQVKDSWGSIMLKYKKLLNTTDKIYLKYRQTDAVPLEVTATWTSTTTFTTTTNVSNLEGYEVEGLQGTGSGFCAHITSISVNAGTYTVTVDDTFTGVTGTAKVRIQNWKKVNVVNLPNESWVQALTASASERIQIKCCMKFTGDNELLELAINNKTYQSI